MFTYREGICFLGKTLELTGNGIALAVTLDVGPRIISLKKPTGDNLMFEDIADAICKDRSAIYGKNKTWHIYGGHRIWLSPENEATYYPDNDPVNYTITKYGAVFTPKAWSKAEVQPVLEVRLPQEGGADIVMGMTNLSGRAQNLCLWSLTALKSGGLLEADLPCEDAGYLPNRNIALWSYTDINDSRLTLTNRKILIKSSPKEPEPLKLGYYNPFIYIKYTFGNTVFVKTAKAEHGAYPDFFCNVETYTNHLIHEVETLSPIVTIDSGKTLWHTEHWELI
ncbi:MAG: hypothetical protein PHI19_00615 [Clostridia bacterium]|nr:hypothetical protein [Clostridia bacterium]